MQRYNFYPKVKANAAAMGAPGGYIRIRCAINAWHTYLYWIKSEYRFLYHFGLKIHQHIDRVVENLTYYLNIAIRENYGTRNSGGELGEKKGVNVPNVAIRLPAITDKDREDLKFGVEQGVDFIAASFVRNAECILEIKSFLRECKAPYIPVIAKVENISRCRRPLSCFLLVIF